MPMDNIQKRYGSATAEEGDFGPPRSSGVGKLFLRILKWNVPLLARMARIILGSDIYCRLPSNLILPHPYGITIYGTTQLGENVVIMQHVTVGTHPDRHSGKHPSSRMNVYIGAGAVVLGPVRIGRSAKIGANAVVTKDIPPRATVVGANRILSRPSAPNVDTP